jgi:solute carrier family 25 (adenine nucleotide translocator) protein 4/5/6/31
MASNEYDIIPILLRFSNWRRSSTERQHLKGYKLRERNILEIYTFNFIPCAITSTLLAPLNRLKIIFQIQSMIPGVLDNQKLNISSVIQTITKEQGYASFFKGNLAYTFKIFSQITSKTVLIDRFKNKAKETKMLIEIFKYRILGANLMIDLFSAFFASLFTLLLSYPFELAYTRLAGLYSTDKSGKFNFPYKTIKQALHHVEINPENHIVRQNSIKMMIDRHYWGLSMAILQSLIFSTISFAGYQALFRLQKREDTIKKSKFYTFMSVLGFTSIIATISSVVSYPIDTLKRIYQVNGARGYRLKYRNSEELIRELKSGGIKPLYNGFSIYLMRSIPFSFIQYTIFQSMSHHLSKK